MPTTQNTRLLTEAQAAQYLSLSRSTLRQGRMNGPREGHLPPVPYIRLGRAIRYDIHELDDFILQHKAGMRTCKTKLALHERVGLTPHFYPLL